MYPLQSIQPGGTNISRLVRCCVAEDVAIDPGGARKRGAVKISSCSPQTRGGRRWQILVCQQPTAELNEELAAQEGKEGHPGCQGQAVAHYWEGVDGGREDLECQGTGCDMDAGRQLATTNYCW